MSYGQFKCKNVVFLKIPESQKQPVDVRLQIMLSKFCLQSLPGLYILVCMMHIIREAAIKILLLMAGPLRGGGGGKRAGDLRKKKFFGNFFSHF